jgi:hypothetical protein
VQITYTSSNTSLAAVLLRYSGVGAIEGAPGENINGLNDVTCANSTDHDTAQLTLTSSVNGSVHVIAVAPREDTISTLSPEYTEIVTGAYGIRVVTAVGTIQNCTIHGMSLNGVRGNIGSTVDIRNTISVGNTLDDFDLRNIVTYFGTNMFSTTNNFDPLSHEGYNRPPPSDLEDLFLSIFPGSEDLNLEPGGHKAGNWATDIAAFTDDIDGVTRIDSRDIGADEAIAGVATPNVLAWEEVEPQRTRRQHPPGSARDHAYSSRTLSSSSAVRAKVNIPPAFTIQRISTTFSVAR